MLTVLTIFPGNNLEAPRVIPTKAMTPPVSGASSAVACPMAESVTTQSATA
jgi:hypothetical protein